MQQSDAPQAGSERRRYARLPINLDAAIAVDGRERVRCAGKDFCVAGMFIRMDPSELEKIRPDERAVLYFTLPNAPTELSLSLVVCRVIPAGVGVSFDNPPQTIIRMLEKLAGADEETEEASLSETQRRFAPEFGRSLPGLLQKTEQFASALAKEFVRQVNDALFLATREATSNAEARAILDAQVKMKDSALLLQERVPELLGRGVAILSDPLGSPRAEAAGAANNLSLVDKDEFEQFLSISSAVAQLEKSLGEPLAELSARFSTMARRVIKDSANPLGPATVCNVVGDTLKGSLSGVTINETVFRTLRHVLEIQLPPLYKDVNQHLQDNGVQPMLDLDKPVKAAPRPARARRLDETSGSAPPSPPTGGSASPGGPVPPGMAGTQPPPWASWNPLPPGDMGMPPGMQVGMPPGAAPAWGQWATPGGGEAGFPALEPDVQEANPGVPLGAPVLGHPIYGPGYRPVKTALGSARAQLSLLRQFQRGGQTMAAPPGEVYPVTQIADALGALAVPATEQEAPPLLSARAVTEQVLANLQARGLRDMEIAPEQQDIIEVVVSLLGSLMHDPRLADVAKSSIRRLQGAAHRAALTDELFFEDTAHPVRQLINRVAAVRPAHDLDDENLEARMNSLMSAAEEKLTTDPAALAPVFQELDQLLDQQARAYDDSVAMVVQTSIEQQRLLKERREKAGLPPVAAPRQPPSEEWERWLRKARALNVGDHFVMNHGSPQAYMTALVWIGDDFSPFVFVDRRGQKTNTLTLEQVAMNLRREIMKPMRDEAAPVERAMSGVVEQLHEEIVAGATVDELTGLMTRKAFLAGIDRKLPVSAELAAGGVICFLVLNNLKQINDSYGLDAGDETLRSWAQHVSSACTDKPVMVARISGGELGLFWESGGVDGVLAEVRALIDGYFAVSGSNAETTIAVRCVAGLSALDDTMVRSEHVLEAAVKACNEARIQGDGAVVVAGADQRQREQLRQVAGYVKKSVERNRLVLLLQEAQAVRADRPSLALLQASAEDRKGKLVPPVLFGEAAGTTEYGWDIDLWSLRQTLRWLTENAADGERFGQLVISISRVSLLRENLAGAVLELLMATEVPPARLCFAITDRDAVGNLDQTAEFINTLRAFGCRFMLDEFGGGQGDYAHVRELAVDYVCLQRAVLEEARHNPKDYAMAKSVNELAHFMGKLTLARLASSDAAEDWIKDLGLDFVLEQSRLMRLKLR